MRDALEISKALGIVFLSIGVACVDGKIAIDRLTTPVKISAIERPSFSIIPGQAAINNGLYSLKRNDCEDSQNTFNCSVNAGIVVSTILVQHLYLYMLYLDILLFTLRLRSGDVNKDENIEGLANHIMNMLYLYLFSLTTFFI